MSISAGFLWSFVILLSNSAGDRVVSDLFFQMISKKPQTVQKCKKEVASACLDELWQNGGWNLDPKRFSRNKADFRFPRESKIFRTSFYNEIRWNLTDFFLLFEKIYLEASRRQVLTVKSVFFIQTIHCTLFHSS